MKLPYYVKTILITGLLAVLCNCAPKEPEFKMLSGGAVDFAALQGKVVLINYWATWCRPCREEIPALNQFQKDYADDVVVLGVNFDGVLGEQLRQQVNELGIEFDTLLNDPKLLFGVSSSGVLPETLVIDRRGEFHQILLGPQTETDLMMLLSSLVEEVQYNGSP